MSNSTASLFFDQLQDQWHGVNFIIVSAENPNGVQASKAENDRRHSALRNLLDVSVFKHCYVEAIGHYGDCSERSFLIATRNDPPRGSTFNSLALHLARCFEQESVLTNSGLLFAEGGKVLPIVNAYEVETVEPLQDYTEVAGRKFIIELG